MYTRKALAWLTAAATSLALTAVATADPGKSPNGPPGPEGNPNQPQSAPEAPPAKQESAPNGQANGHDEPKSDPPRNDSGTPSSGSRGKSQTAPNNGKPKSNNGKSKSNHANPSPGTPRKGGREDRPSPKVTLCHATGSETNPYVEITISENGLNGHGFGDHHKKEGRWDDIIPVPAGGCPTTAPTQTSGGGGEQQQNTTTTTTTPTSTETVAVAPERVTDAGEQGVLGAQASGGSDEPSPGGGGVLGAQASGGGDDAAPAAAKASRRATVGSLPFTGFELAFIVIVGLATLLGGIAMRRSLANNA